jgi:quinol monooxygenase YgiN
MIHVIATIQLNPGTRAAFLKEFHRLVPFVQAEDGCIEYGPTIDVPGASAIQERVGEDAVVVVEKWASVEALHAHSKAPHMDDYRVRVKEYVKSVKLLVTKPA